MQFIYPRFRWHDNSVTIQANAILLYECEIGIFRLARSSLQNRFAFWLGQILQFLLALKRHYSQDTFWEGIVGVSGPSWYTSEANLRPKPGSSRIWEKWDWPWVPVIRIGLLRYQYWRFGLVFNSRQRVCQHVHKLTIWNKVPHPWFAHATIRTQR